MVTRLLDSFHHEQMETEESVEVEPVIQFNGMVRLVSIV